jgi:hypothetical protein
MHAVFMAANRFQACGLEHPRLLKFRRVTRKG